jgi:ABC-type transport system involved in multi-copper enzyme maturation permease subunit
MLVFLLIITIFIGTQLVYREIERKTVYMLLSKPVTRDAFYLGKFVGLALTIAVVTGVMGAAFLILVAFKTHAVSPIQIAAIIMMMLEAWLLTAVGMLFSAFTAPLSSAVYTLCLALIGHASTALLSVADKNGPAVKYILQFIYYVFPNLEKFNLRNDVIFGAGIDGTFTAWAVGYGLVYTAALLLLGTVIIRKHEF